MLKKLLLSTLIISAVLSNTLFAGEPDNVRESTVIYKLKDDASPAQLKRFNSLVNKENIITKREIKGSNINVVKLKNIKGLEKVFSKQLIDTGAVKFAEPDASVPHALVPNDTDYASQWHHNTLNSEIAWDTIVGPSDLNSVKVCVLDTGVDTDHPDLANNLLLPGYNAYLEVDGNVEDIYGHGTSTSGLIGAVGNNNEGVTGMAWNIKIIPVQISQGTITSSAYISDMAVGIRWCADQGAKVANLSYGGAQYPTISEAAQDLKDSGGLLFMSAGNDGIYHDTDTFPDYSSFVVVGATDVVDEITWFSEYGPYIDVVAPGLYIYTTEMNASYGSVSGTSFSSPITAGLAALVYSVNPDFTPTEVENIIFNTSVDLGVVGGDDIYGHGRVDAGAAVVEALDYLASNTPPIANTVITPLNGIAPLEVTFDANSSTDDGTIVSYLWDFGDGNSGSGITTTHTYINSGDYDATLTVTDNMGAQATSDPTTIHVEIDSYFIEAPSLTAAVDANSVTLNWTANSGNETGFNIQKATKIRGKYAFVDLVTVGTATQYTDSAEIGSYKYRINAFNDNVISDFSNEVSVKVVTTLPADPTPGDLVAPTLSYSINGLDVVLNYSDECPSGAVCSYSVEKGDAKVRGKINFTPLTTQSGLTLTDNAGSGTFYYRVYITTQDGVNSDYSNVISARIK